MIRKVFFWSHLVVGLVTGVVAFMLCLTGAILAFESQIVNWAERDARGHPPSATAELLPPAALIVNAAKVEKDQLANLEWFADPDMPVRLRYQHEAPLLLNGYTGEVLGRGAAGLRSFLRWMVTLHVNLTMQKPGNWMVAVSNACFVFLCVSGLWIWCPRHWRWKALRSSLVMRFDVGGKARDWNWHNVFGFWLLLPLLCISAAGLVLSFKAMNEGWRDFASKHLLKPASPATKLDVAATPATSNWPQWMKLVQARHPNWRSIILNGNGSPNKDGQLTFVVNLGEPRHRADVINVKLDTRTGRLIEERDWGVDDAHLRARAVARLGHTGEILGTWGQALAFLACLAGLVLVYTGFALSWRRFFPKKARA